MRSQELEEAYKAMKEAKTYTAFKDRKRHYMGFEIDKGYWEMSQRRLDGVAGVIKKGGAVMEQLSLL